MIIILIFFSGGNRLQIFRAHHPQHDCVDEGRFVVPQYFHCYHAGIRFRCILHLQYGFRYLYRSDSIPLYKLRTLPRLSEISEIHKFEHIGEPIFDIPFLIQSHAKSNPVSQDLPATICGIGLDWLC